MKPSAVTVAASERIYARVIAPTSLPKTDSARSGMVATPRSPTPNTLSKSADRHPQEAVTALDLA